MTLPYTLLPSGSLSAMRQVANSFMTTPVILYDVTETYSLYGEPVRSSGVVWSGLVYFGKVTARDLDFVTSTDFYRMRDEGVETKYLATVLLPFFLEVSNTYKFKTSSTEWDVVWDNNPTSDAVQVYTKVIVRDTRYTLKKTLGA